MKYSIGDIVILIRDKDIKNRYIIIATSRQKLDNNYLKSLTQKLNIKDISRIADNVIQITPGFEYKICKCANEYYDRLCVLDGRFVDIFNEDEIKC